MSDLNPFDLLCQNLKIKFDQVDTLAEDLLKQQEAHHYRIKRLEEWVEHLISRLDNPHIGSTLDEVIEEDRKRQLNQETKETFEKTDRGEELHRANSVDELFDDLLEDTKTPSPWG